MYYIMYVYYVQLHCETKRVNIYMAFYHVYFPKITSLCAINMKWRLSIKRYTGCEVDIYTHLYDTYRVLTVKDFTGLQYGTLDSFIDCVLYHKNLNIHHNC